MEKVNYKTENLLKQKIEMIKKWYPSVIEQNETNEDIINFEALKIAMELDLGIVKKETENYKMTWPDKNKTIALSEMSINKILRPLVDQSINFFNTKNIYIEGDNLDALKILRNSYLENINIIYIDPPYNTGNDFIYNDNFTQSKYESELKEGKKDEYNNILVQNFKSDGRFHTNWLNMIYPRLKLARDLLSEDGVIFISIDDNEQANLKKICDEIFGENNFIGRLIWQSNNSVMKQVDYFKSDDFEYIFCYAKNKRNVKEFNKQINNSIVFQNIDNDPKGNWFSSNATYKTDINHKNYFPIKLKSGKEIFRKWRFSEKQYLNGEIDLFFNEDNVPRLKIYEKDYDFNNKSNPSLLISLPNFPIDSESEDLTELEEKSFNFYNKLKNNILQMDSFTVAKNELKKYDILFDTPKPVNLIKYFINLYKTNKEEILFLDFFSGSATSAEAVLRINNENLHNKQINYILVQIQENNIIHQAQKRLKYISDEIKNNYIDTGFRVFKVDSNNINDNMLDLQDINQDLFTNLTKNFESIKKDRNELDLVFQSILDCRLTLDKKINKQMFENKTYYNVDNNFIICYFGDKIDDIEFIKYLAKFKPNYIYFKESSFESDQIKINIEEIFKNYSNDTVIKIF